MNADDLFMKSLYGPNYGRADQSTAPGEESTRSAADPARRNQLQEASSGWFAPSRSVFGAQIDESMGIRPGAAGLMPLESDYADVTADELPEVEVEAVPAIDADIRAYIESNPGAVLTTATLLTDALHYVEEHISRGDEMELAEAMARLGYEKAQRRIDGARVWVWVSRTSTDAVTNLEQE